jgi:hypothetical protein
MKKKMIIFSLLLFVGMNCFSQQLRIISTESNPASGWLAGPGAWPVGGLREQWNAVINKYNLVRLQTDPFEKNELEDRIHTLINDTYNVEINVQPFTAYLTMGNRRFVCFAYGWLRDLYIWVFEAK